MRIRERRGERQQAVGRKGRERSVMMLPFTHSAERVCELIR